MAVLIRVRCNRHPEYKGKRMPDDCEACLSIYKLAKNGWAIRFADGSKETAECERNAE